MHIKTTYGGGKTLLSMLEKGNLFFCCYEHCECEKKEFLSCGW
jgi:hypothetical protein